VAAQYQRVATRQRQQLQQQQQQRQHPRKPRQQTRHMVAAVTPVKTTTIREDDCRQQIGMAGDRGAAIARAYVHQTPGGNVQQRAAGFRCPLENPEDLLNDNKVKTLQKIQRGQV
jgi:hypothetical protein